MKNTNVVRLSAREASEMYVSLCKTLSEGDFSDPVSQERYKFLLKLKAKLLSMLEGKNND